MRRHRYSLLTLLTSLFAYCATLNAVTISVLDTGAKADGATLATAPIQRAIDTAATSGGGTIIFPAGRYLTGTLILRSNITLHLETGAVLLGSPRLEDYPAQESTYREGIIEIDGKHQAGYPMRHLLYARNAENIAIEGNGVIDGNGDSYFSTDKTTAHARPTPLIELIDSRQIRIDNITIRNAPGWTVHPKNCDDVRIRAVNILNHLRAINSDGIDIDSTRNVIISDCRIEAGDDCIVLKTTQPNTGETTPVENVVVTNCVLKSSATALKLGTESHGDFRHILFNNCVIRDSRTGLALFAKDGGTMEDIRFSDITMTTAPKWGKGYELPIVVELSQRARDSRIGAIRDVSFSNIKMASKGRIMVRGLDEQHPLENITLKHVSLNMLGCEDYKQARNNTNSPTSKNTKGNDYNATTAAFVVAHTRRLTLDTIDATSCSQTTPTLTKLLHLDDVPEPVLRNLTSPFPDK